jgi:electron transfer flavoprotein alpha/beta subunit
MNAVVLVRAVVDAEAAGSPQVTLDAPSVAALCQALDWRGPSDATLTALASGPPDWEPALREALALGAAAAVRVEVAEGGAVDIAWTARALAGAMPSDTAFVFAGAAASDHGSGVLPAALAGCLDWPLISDVVRATHTEGRLQAEVDAGAGVRCTYETEGPAVIVAAPVPPPPVYAPLAKRLAAARISIQAREAITNGAAAGECSRFLGYGPGKPRTKHLLKPSASARAGDRLSQLMSGGAQRQSSKLSGDAADLARQLADLLERSGLLPR